MNPASVDKAFALLTKVLGLTTLEMVVAIAVVALAIHAVSRISVAIHSARASVESRYVMDIAKHILWSVFALMAALLFAIAFNVFGLWAALFLVVLVGLLDGVLSLK